MKKSGKYRTHLLASTLLLCGFAGQAMAASITFNFVGIIDFIQPGGAFDGLGVTTGDTFDGFYTFESVVLDSDGTAEIGVYSYNALAPSGMTLTLNIGTLTTSTDPANPNSGFRILAFPTFDEYRVNTQLPELPGSSGALFVDIPTNWGGGTITTDALPLLPPDLATATFNEILINDLQGGQFAGRLTLLELRPVPLPTAWLLLASGSLGLFGFSRKRGGGTVTR